MPVTWAATTQRLMIPDADRDASPASAHTNSFTRYFAQAVITLRLPNDTTGPETVQARLDSVPVPECGGAGGWGACVALCWAGREEFSFVYFVGRRPSSDDVDCYQRYCAQEYPVPDCFYPPLSPCRVSQTRRCAQRPPLPCPTGIALPDHLPPPVTRTHDGAAIPFPRSAPLELYRAALLGQTSPDLLYLSGAFSTPLPVLLPKQHCHPHSQLAPLLLALSSAQARILAASIRTSSQPLTTSSPYTVSPTSPCANALLPGTTHTLVQNEMRGATRRRRIPTPPLPAPRPSCLLQLGRTPLDWAH